MHMQRMRSLMDHPFGGKELKKGSTFYANPQEKRVLECMGRAIAIQEDGASIRTSQIAEDEPSHAPTRKRGYNRRNMRARPDQGDYDTK